MGFIGRKGRKRISAQISNEEKDRLFNLYIKPNFNSIRTLTQRYTDRQLDVDANFNYVISQMHRYFASYNPDMSLETWLHIVTKRYCFGQNKIRAKVNSMVDGSMFRSDGELSRGGHTYEINPFSLMDSVSDDVYYALTKVSTEYLSVFLLRMQGYSIKEIAEMEYSRGHITIISEKEIKKRLSTCRKELKELLAKRGITQYNYASFKRHNKRNTGDDQ